VAHYYACKFGLNRLRTDGDIRQKAAITAIMENMVVAIYRLRPIQKLMEYQRILRMGEERLPKKTVIQESPAVADKPVRRLRKVCTVYVRAVGL